MSEHPDSYRSGSSGDVDFAGLVRRVKLVPPAPTPDAVALPAVADRLALAQGFPVTLVTAPAGYGKTTQLALWQRGATDTGWVSLAPEDDDPGRLFRLLAAALARLDPVFAPGLAPLLASGLDDPRRIGESLADLLADLDDDLTLILDDLHDLADPRTLALLDHLLGTPPPRLHLVLAGRIEPPIAALDRLDQRGRLLRIDERHLRFAPEQVRLLLPRTIPDRDGLAASIAARVEGWPAGVRAFTALHGQDSGEGPVAVPDESPAALRRFVASEVLSRQPADAVALLRATAVLTRITPGLAAALHGDMTPGHAQRLLDGLVAARAFVAPDGRDGYRVHAVVRETLRERMGPDAVAAQEAAAAAWFAARDDVPAAVAHALAAGPEAAADLIERHVFDWFITAHWGDIRAALDRLPEAMIEERPALAIARASTMIPLGLGAQAERLVDRADALLDAADAADPGAPEVRRLRWEAAASRCTAAQFTGRVPQVLDLARMLMEADDASIKAVADGIPVWGFGMIELGRLDEAEATLAAIAASTRPAKIRLAALVTLLALANERLDPDALASWGAMTVAAAERAGFRRDLAWGQFSLALVAYHRNDLDEADRHVLAGQPFAAGSFAVADQQLTILRAQIAAARGTPAAALAIARTEERTLQRAGAHALLPLAAALRLRYAAETGDIADLDQPLPDDLIGAPLALTQPIGDPAINWSAALLARDHPGDSLRAVDLLERRLVTVGGWRRQRAALLPMLAAAREAAGDRDAAVAAISDAIRLDPGRFLRHYADAGPFALAAIAALAESGDPMAPAAARLLAALAQPFETSGTFTNLTDRESDVLVLMSEWLTNKEIGERLGISPHTVRQHSVSIFRKLGVGDRREAVARARASAARESPAS